MAPKGIGFIVSNRTNHTFIYEQEIDQGNYITTPKLRRSEKVFHFYLFFTKKSVLATNQHSAKGAKPLRHPFVAVWL